MAKNNRVTKKTEEQALTENATQEQTPSDETGAGKTAVVSVPYGLNLREGPSFDYKVLHVLPGGTQMTVLDLPCGAVVPGWVLAYTGDQVGWVSSQYIRVEA